MISGTLVGCSNYVGLTNVFHSLPLNFSNSSAWHVDNKEKLIKKGLAKHSDFGKALELVAAGN